MKRASCEGTAIWALTPNGARLARRMAQALDGSVLFLSQKLPGENADAVRFTRLQDAIDGQFTGFSRHIFIMAAGIVVRCIAGHLNHKTTDPAVVVCDEAGRFAVSLVSGHLGGANGLAREAARITGGQAVITTATDVNQVPAIDLIAVENRLTIENPAAIKSVNMALIDGSAIRIHDPYEKVVRHLPPEPIEFTAPDAFVESRAGIFVDHMRLDLPPQVLILRPRSLVAGMGCNRGTAVGEMHDLLEETFTGNHLAISSLRALATVDLKAEEPGLLALAESLNVPLLTFTREQLNHAAPVPNPSAMVEKHIGVKSVCEAAALLATHQGRLIVPKHKTANATLAVAADGCTSSASDPATPGT